MSNLLLDVFTLVMTFFVPGVVWTVLIAGLYQLIREKVRQVHVTPQRPQRLERYSQQAG